MVAGTVFFSDDQQPLVTISSTPINEEKDGSYLNASVQICIATTVVNVAAFVVIRQKEKTGVNGLIVTDCFANILTAMVQLLDNLPSSTSRYVAPVFCIWLLTDINLLEYPIPAPTAVNTTLSQKPSHGDISGTKCGIIDPLVSKRPEKT